MVSEGLVSGRGEHGCTIYYAFPVGGARRNLAVTKAETKGEVYAIIEEVKLIEDKGYKKN